MLKPSEHVDFVKQGLVHYPDARETVDYFEQIVQRMFEQAFASKRAWNGFRPIFDENGGLQMGRGTGQTDRSISVWANGEIAVAQGGTERAWFTLSLAWNPRACSEPVVVWAGVNSGRGTAVPLLDVPGRDRRLRVGPVQRRNERRMILVPADDVELEEALGILLDSVDDALAARTKAPTTAGE